MMKTVFLWSGIACACLCALHGKAADYRWNNAEGGDYNDAANWSPAAVPGPTDNVILAKEGEYAIAFDGSYTNAQVTTQLPGGIVTFNIGAGNEYRANSSLRMSNPATVSETGIRIPSGTLSVNGHVMVGDGAVPGTSMEVTGPTACVKTTGFDISAGYGSGSNTIVVVNGGKIESARYIRAGYGVNSHGNLIHVSGAGTTAFVNSQDAGFIVGDNGCDNTMIVEDSALALVDGAKITGNAGLAVGNGDNSTGNQLIIRSGAIFSNAVNTATVGVRGTGNRLLVDAASFYNRGNFQVGSFTGENHMELRNGGAFMTVSHLMVGHQAASCGNTVLVTDPGTSLRTSGYDINVGADGHFNSFVVSNGAFASSYRNIHVGYYTGAPGKGSNNELIVTDPGTILQCDGLNNPANSLLVGYAGTNNVVRIENGALFQSLIGQYAGLAVGGHVDGKYNRVLVQSDAIVTNRGLVAVGQSGSFNEMTVDNASVVCQQYTYVGQNAGACSNLLTVCNGSYFEMRKLYLGVNAGADDNRALFTGDGTYGYVSSYDIELGRASSNNWITVQDHATLFVDRHIYIGGGDLGLNATASNNVLRVDNATLTCTNNGTKAILKYGATLDVRGSQSDVRFRTLTASDDSTLAFTCDEHGLPSVQVLGDLTLDDTTKLVIDARGCPIHGEPIPVLSYNRLLGAIPEENITLYPDGSTIDFTTGKCISIKVPIGTVISIW